MATWLLRNPSRIEILHLIQQHNRLNPSKSQQIPLDLSLEEAFRLKILQQEQKAIKRNFTAVQRSAYSLRRYIEEVLKYNSASGSTPYDRANCAAAMRDFLTKLEGEMEAVDRLKSAVDAARILENGQREAERTTNTLQENVKAKENEIEDTAEMITESSQASEASEEANVDEMFKGEEFPKMQSGVIIKINPRKSKNDVESSLPSKRSDRPQPQDGSGSESGNSTDSTSSFDEITMSDLEQRSSQNSLAREAPQEVTNDLHQGMADGKYSPTESKDSMPPSSNKAVKGILKRLSSFGELPIQSSGQKGPSGEAYNPPLHPALSFDFNPSFVPSKRKLHTITDLEAHARERERIMAKALRKAHQKGLELSEEVKGFEYYAQEADSEA